MAPTENHKKPLILKRTKGHWTLNLRGAAFVGEKGVHHKTCPTTEHAFTNHAAAKKYIAQHKSSLGDTKPMSFSQFYAKAR